MNDKFQNGPEYPKLLDKNDPLAHFRQRFYLKEGEIYMCGNSLGLASKDAIVSLQRAIDQWKEIGLQIWSVDACKHYKYSTNIGKLIAPLVGADANEVAVMECTTTCIHITVSTFYKPKPEKYKILVDDINFSTDRYAIDSQVRLKGYDPKDAVKVVKAIDGKFVREIDIIKAMTPDVALVFLPTVYYKTAQVLDMEKLSKAARDRGIIIGWDLCHAIGAIEIDFKAINTDFAVWCNYKYLNGGPGASAGVYINKKHFHTLPGLTGWYGNKTDTQFLMRQEFDHQKDASGWQLGAPHIFSMAPLEGSLKIMNEAGMFNIRKKSLELTSYLMYLTEEKLGEYGVVIGNLGEDSKRGGHVCLEHKEAFRTTLALKARGVIADFRDPNIIRMTPVALYTSYTEVYKVVDIIKDIMETESYLQYSLKRGLLT